MSLGANTTRTYATSIRPDKRQPENVAIGLSKIRKVMKLTFCITVKGRDTVCRYANVGDTKS